MTRSVMDPAQVAALGMKNVPKTYSFSRINGYTDCSYKYYLQHIIRELDAYSASDATLLGNWCHKALETVLEAEEDAVPQSPYEILAGEGGLWDQELERLKLTDLKPRLQEYAHHYSGLMLRASAAYKGADKIRKADGSVAAKPSMTKGWGEYARANKLDQKAVAIDLAARRAAPKEWNNLSLSTVYAESVGIMHHYKHPDEIYEVLRVELPVSELRLLAANEDGSPMFDEAGEPVTTSRVRGPHPAYSYKDAKDKSQVVVIEVLNPFYLPKLDEHGKLMKNPDGSLVFRDDACFSGYIDLLERNREGEIGVTDHKSNGGEPPNIAKVARHEQFNVYGLIVEELTGELVKWLRMNHLRSSTLVSAPFDRKRAELVFERMLSMVDAIEKKVFVKHNPDNYVTQCATKNYKGELVLCEGFKLCHPAEYAEFSRKAA